MSLACVQISASGHRILCTQYGDQGHIFITRHFMVNCEKTRVYAGNTKRGSIIVPLTSCLTGLDSILQIKTKIVSCHTADSKPVKQKLNGKVIRPPLCMSLLVNSTPV